MSLLLSLFFSSLFSLLAPLSSLSLSLIVCFCGFWCFCFCFSVLRGSDRILFLFVLGDSAVVGLSLWFVVIWFWVCNLFVIWFWVCDLFVIWFWVCDLFVILVVGGWGCGWWGLVAVGVGNGSGFGFLMVVMAGLAVSGGLVVFVWDKRDTHRERERKRWKLRIKRIKKE